VELCGDDSLCRPCEVNNAAGLAKLRAEQSHNADKNATSQLPVPTITDIRCDICKYEMDSTCSGIPSEAIHKLIDIIQFTGWVCTGCRTSSQQKTDKLQTALTLVNEKLCDLMATVDCLQQKLENTTGSVYASNDKVMSKTDIAVEIHKTLSAESKRKCNIVITGLPESTNATDEQAFLTLCEEHFSVKPPLSHLGCRRHGKVSQQYPSRKLLVHLTSEQASTDVLTEAKKLRHRSDDPVIASTVYINPDLYPQRHHS